MPRRPRPFRLFLFLRPIALALTPSSLLLLLFLRRRPSRQRGHRGPWKRGGRRRSNHRSVRDLARFGVPFTFLCLSRRKDSVSIIAIMLPSGTLRDKRHENTPHKWILLSTMKFPFNLTRECGRTKDQTCESSDFLCRVLRKISVQESP